MTPSDADTPLTAESRTYNSERSGYDVTGPCWGCGQAIDYFVDEDGTPRDVRPALDVTRAAAGIDVERLAEALFQSQAERRGPDGMGLGSHEADAAAIAAEYARSTPDAPRPETL